MQCELSINGSSNNGSRADKVSVGSESADCKLGGGAGLLVCAGRSHLYDVIVLTFFATGDL